MDRIDFSTSDEFEALGSVAGLRSTHRRGDVLAGGNPELAPENLTEDFEPKEGLVGASPDGDPDSVEAYESGQDDGQIS